MLFPIPPFAIPPAVDIVVGQAIDWQQKECEAEAPNRAMSDELRWYSNDRLCDMLLEIHDFNSTSAASGASIR